jgi:hypothetical protein
MTIAPQIAMLPEPHPILCFATESELEDRTMKHASHVFCLLTNLTEEEIDELAPIDRQLLQQQLERVHRMVVRASIVNDARKAAAFLEELRDGRGRE